MNCVGSVDAMSHSAGQAAATIYLVSKSVDRLSEGRRIATLMGSRNESDESMIRRGIHPDVIELVPPEGKERIGIGQIRTIIRAAQFAPVQSASKVCLVPCAEGLTIEAANALLKILEEPPRGLRFVLLAEHPSDLLPTIVSRSRLMRIPIASQEQIAARLTRAGYEAGPAYWITQLALHGGELDQFITTPVDIERVLAETTATLTQADVQDIIGACLGNDAILRRQGMLHLLTRAVARDGELLTLGVRVLATQTRESLAQFLHDLLVITFHLTLSSHRASRLQDPLADQTQAMFGIHRLHSFCFALDEAHRSLAVYGPVEGILLSLLLLPEGEDHAS